jgi:hypothetical protein
VSVVALTRLVLVERGRRIAGLLAFAALFIIAGMAARAIAGREGHVEMSELLGLGNYPLMSALVVMAWLLSRFPLIATLVLLTGIVSADRTRGYTRIYAVRPASLLAIYGPRTIALIAIAFGISAILLPLVDVIVAGQWAGPTTLVVSACYVIVYSGVVVLLSVFFRSEGWIALSLAISAMLWDALRRSGFLAESPPGVREVVSFILPPQGPLFRIETAYAELQPMPWTDVAYVIGYGLVLLLAAAVFVGDREV